MFVTPESKAREAGPAIDRSIFSFRALHAGENAGYAPWHLRSVRVARGDTVQKLARRMAPETFKEERFRALNGLDPARQLKPGEWVKVIE